jgi:hypothetical protein
MCEEALMLQKCPKAVQQTAVHGLLRPHVSRLFEGI